MAHDLVIHEEETVNGQPIIRDGRLPVPGGAGLGVTVDPAKLARYRIS